ncbi:MAG: hypothetical protein LHW44_00745 [Candidatus Cloacimonetes bacterium]|nr:hypothetical protein [Candidatus Cloacimonadota bacterium]
MKAKFEQSEAMTPDEKFNAVARLSQALEENFITLGELLSDIKRGKLFKFKGYGTFKEFVETEYKMSSSLASKMVQTFDLFIEEMDVDEISLNEIGFDRLQMIRPLVQKSDWGERDEWVDLASELSTADLREHIKEYREQQKEADTDVKKVYIDQYMEKMLAWFNCSRAELNFKLALYFQDADAEAVKKLVKERQRAFETELQTNKEDAP